MENIQGEKIQFSDYRLSLVEEILGNIPLQKTSAKSFGGTPTKVLQGKSWSHFPKALPPTGKKMNP